jgi:hypothetical protein
LVLPAAIESSCRAASKICSRKGNLSPLFKIDGKLANPELTGLSEKMALLRASSVVAKSILGYFSLRTLQISALSAQSTGDIQFPTMLACFGELLAMRVFTSNAHYVRSTSDCERTAS